MARFVLLTAVLLLGIPASAQEKKGFLEIEEVRRTFEAVVPLVEKETGRKAERRIDVKIGSPEKMLELLTEELTPQMKILGPKLDEEARRNQARATAGLFSRALLAKYGLKDRAVYVNPGAFERFDGLYPELRVATPEILRAVLIHETVHALDDDAHGILSRVGKLKSTSELEVWNALFEGHAQYVTRRILLKEEKSELFDRFERLVTSPPPGMGEGERYVASLLAMSIVTAYVDGRRFFEGLEKEGKKGFVAEVFAAPPKDRRVIFHPERYYHPERTPVGRDLAGMWKEVKERFGDEWTPIQRKVDPSELGKAFGGMLDKDEVARSIRTVVDSQVLILNYKPAPGTKMVIFSVTELESVGAGRVFYDLDLKLMKTKDERMKQGLVRIRKAEYGTLKTSKPERLSAARKEVQAGPQMVVVRSVLFQSDRFVTEIVYSNAKAEDAELVKLTELMCAALRRED